MNAIARLLFTADEDASYVDLMPFRAYRRFDEGIVECKDGELMAAWRYTGIDHESSSARELDYLSFRLNDLMRSFGKGWAMWTEALRLETNDYPDEADSHFPDEVSRMIDRERRTAVLEQDAHYETVAFVVLMYRPPPKMAQKFFDAMLEQPEGAAPTSLEDKQLEYFRRAVAQFEGAFGSIFPLARLKPYRDGRGHTYCDFLRLLHYCATGVMRPVRVPDPRIGIDMLICGQDFYPSFHPKVGDQFVGVVSVEGVQAYTTPAMLAAFDSRPLRYRWSTRYLYMDRVEAIAELAKFRRKWKQKEVGVKDQLMQNPNPRVNLDAVRMVADADEAFAEVQSGDVNQGLYTSVFVIYAEDLDELTEACTYFRNFLNENGFGGRIESMNATSAFLGSIPGNASTNVDKMQISTANLADLMPVATAWPGEEFAPCDKYPPFSPPLIQAETPNSTPFRLNLHVSDVGHTFVAGATGSGKSTLLCLIEAQFLRYRGAQVFAFDKGMSMYALARGVGGRHFELGADTADGAAYEGRAQMMPLADIDSHAGLLWAMTWIERCVELQGTAMSPARRTAIREALLLLRESPSRTITEFRSNLQDEGLREAMEYYTIGGAAGHILDGAVETTELANLNVFELGDLMPLGERVVLPTLLYLFRRIEKALDGRPTLIVLDECWLMLDHPVFREQIREWLKTLRKANAAVVMATQSIVDAMKSGIVETILDSTATKILLPHPSVGDDQHRGFYASTLGLNEREIEMLAHGVPKRQYYYRSEAGRRLFELNLRPKTLAFVGRSSPEDVATLKAMIADRPDDWRERWLEHCAA